MIHFFDKLEREINFQKEYEKIERMFSVEEYPRGRLYGYTIEEYVEKHFRYWKKKKNYTSFEELRNQLGFNYEMDKQIDYYSFKSDITIDSFFLFGEMLYNLLYDYNWIEPTQEMIDGIIHIFDTIKFDIEKAGFEVKRIKDDYYIVEKNAISIDVCDYIPELSDVIIEYNHYLLKGKTSRKKVLLKLIADSLEPKRSFLNSIDKTATSDFFWMVNSMDVRHNNCDPSDSSKYNPKFAALSNNEKEKWFDIIYEQALFLYAILKNNERKAFIHSFKE